MVLSLISGGHGEADQRKQAVVGWIDVVWLAFLVGLALLPPIAEIHKQLILLTIGIFQLLEGRMMLWLPRYGRVVTVGVKILLATLLLVYTGEFAINSSYYPIYYLPVVTAATCFGPLGTIFWTTITSLVYCSLLIPALQFSQLTSSGVSELAIRSFFFFLAAMLVNRFVIQNQKQMERLQSLSETLATTNRQLQEAQEEAQRSERLAALGQLSAGLAHEIRNPLGVIKGSAEILQRKLNTNDVLLSELSQNISSEVSRLNGLIGRFLDFARPASVELRPAEILPMLERALASVRVRFPQSKIVVSWDVAKMVPMILADEPLCEQVFANLIQNSYEAINGREGELYLSAQSTTREGQNGVVVDIRDTGPGVPNEQKERIFNPFMTTKKSGVGLGLSIVAKTIDDHRGTIRLVTDAQPGAHFQIFLPAAPDKLLKKDTV